MDRYKPGCRVCGITSDKRFRSVASVSDETWALVRHQKNPASIKVCTAHYTWLFNLQHHVSLACFLLHYVYHIKFIVILLVLNWMLSVFWLCRMQMLSAPHLLRALMILNSLAHRMQTMVIM